MYNICSENNLENTSILFDFIKTFDQIDQGILLRVICCIGKGGNLSKNLPEQQIAIKENWKSETEEVAVHLGCTSVHNNWAPTLFFINILNDSVFQSTLFLLADNRKLLYNKNLGKAHGIKQDLDSTMSWSYEN